MIQRLITPVNDVTNNCKGGARMVLISTEKI